MGFMVAALRFQSRSKGQHVTSLSLSPTGLVTCCLSLALSLSSSSPCLSLALSLSAPPPCLSLALSLCPPPPCLSLTLSHSRPSPCLAFALSLCPPSPCHSLALSLSPPACPISDWRGSGSAFRVQCLKCRIHSSGFEVQNLWFRV